MSAPKLAEFLTGIAPDLIKFGTALFRASKGDVRKARRNIRSRTKQLAEGRAEVDRRADRKFG